MSGLGKPLFQLFPDLGSSRYVVRDSEISVLDTGDRKEVFRFYEPHQQEVLTILYEKNTQNGLVTLDLDPIYQQTYKILNGRRTGQYAIYKFGVCCYMGWWKSNGDIDKQCYIEYTSKASMMVHCDPSTGAILYRGGMGKKPCEYEGFGVQYDLTSGKPLYYGLFHNNRLYRVYQRFLDDESMIEYGYKDDDLVMNSKQEELSEYLESKPQQPKGFIVYRGNYKPHPYLFFMRDGEGCETRNGVQRYGLWRKNKCVEEWTIDTSGLVFDHLRGYVNDAFLKGDAFDAKTNQPKKLQRPKMPKLAKNDSIDKPKISVNTEVVTPNVEGLKPSAGSSQNPSQNPETQQEPDSHTPKSGDSMNSQSVPSILQYSKSRSAQSLPKNVVPNTQSSGSFTAGNRNGTPSVPRDSIRAPVSDAPNSSTMASTLQSANSTTPVSTNGPISGAQAPKTAHNSMQNNQSLQDPTPVVLDAMANLHTYSNGLQTGYSNEYPTPLSNLHRSSALLHASSSTSLTQSQRGPVFNDARMMFGKQGVVPFIPGTSNSPVVISQRGLAAETASNEKETLVASMADFVTASREIEHLTIADGSCNEPEFLSFDVHSFSKLVSIRIGDNCCTHVLKFNLFRIKALETVYIGKNSFRCEEKFLENTEFVLEELDCMTKLEIGENSFEFFHSVELRGIDSP